MIKVPTEYHIFTSQIDLGKEKGVRCVEFLAKNFDNAKEICGWLGLSTDTNRLGTLEMVVSKVPDGLVTEWDKDEEELRSMLAECVEQGFISKDGKVRRVLGELPLTKDGCVIGMGAKVSVFGTPYTTSKTCLLTTFDEEKAESVGGEVGLDIRTVHPPGHRELRCEAWNAKGGA